VRAAAVAVWLTGASGAVHAADPDGDFNVKGEGLQSCESYLDAAKNRDAAHLLYRAWLNGYLTRFNQATPGTFDLAPWQTIDELASLIGDYCRARPQHDLVTAATAMAVLLYPYRQVSADDRLELSGGGATVEVPKETLKQAQAVLKSQGYYSGAIDGLYGPMTAEAIRKFQEASGVEQTQILDKPTLWAIVRADAGAQ
jgi:hypothetical protein